MIASHLLPVLALVLTAAVTEERYEAGGVEFEDCDSAIRYGKSLGEPVTVECHLIMTMDPDPAAKPQPARGKNPLPTPLLKDYRQTRELSLDHQNASGVAFLSDDTVLLTFQSFLQIRDINGRHLHTIGPVDGDIEGLEYDGSRLLAIDERGSTHLDLSIDGMEIATVRERPLLVGGVECIAYDGVADRVYYGHEATGHVLDEKLDVLVSLERDLAACTVHDGQFMALASHPWRESAWYRIDMETWEVAEKRELPDGDWEGIACRGNRCVLVREMSEKSGAAMVIFEASPAQR